MQSSENLLEYLSKPIIDSQGNITELGELIADDHAIDLDQWIDSEAFLLGCQPRLIGVACKIQNEETLTHAERTYLYKFRKREQKTLL